MISCFFVSDLHGRPDRYTKLFDVIEKEKPSMVFIGGDITPHFMIGLKDKKDFFRDLFFPGLQKLKEILTEDYPKVFLIMGNDDARADEINLIEGEKLGLFNYPNQTKVHFGQYVVYGYSFIPPSPFRLKDWEKYDVSRYVDPGCIPPTEGFRTTEIDEDPEYSSIRKDLESMTDGDELANAVFLFHSPPYKTLLDRAALDGQMIDHVPLDLHVGSIAIKRFIEEKQPLISMHGHIHESTRLTGHWRDKIGRTEAFNAAHDGPELSLIRFDLEHPEKAERFLL